MLIDHQRGDVIVPLNRTRNVARGIIAVVTLVVLLIPVIILNAVTSTVPRFVVVFVAAGLFVSAITAFNRLSMAEIFAAGATYTAVLVVFVSGNGISPPPGS